MAQTVQSLMTRIVPHLWIGNEYAAKNKKYLQFHHIKAVIDLRKPKFISLPSQGSKEVSSQPSQTTSNPPQSVSNNNPVETRQMISSRSSPDTSVLTSDFDSSNFSSSSQPEIPEYSEEDIKITSLSQTYTAETSHSQVPNSSQQAQYLSPEIEYFHIPVSDYGDDNLEPIFRRCFSVIDDYLSLGKSVLVHCEQGVNRSPTIVIGYLISSGKVSLKEAYTFCKTKRRMIAPHSNYFSQLVELEKRITGSSSMSLSEYKMNHPPGSPNRFRSHNVRINAASTLGFSQDSDHLRFGN